MKALFQIALIAIREAIYTEKRDSYLMVKKIIYKRAILSLNYSVDTRVFGYGSVVDWIILVKSSV